MLPRDNYSEEVLLPLKFKPEYLFDLVRLGSKNDGGYLVCNNSIKKSDILISGGLAYEYSFEEDYLAYTNNQIECYDHTINNNFYLYRWSGIFLKRLFTKPSRLKEVVNNLKKPFKFNKFINNKRVNFFAKALGYGDHRYLTLEKIILNHSIKKNFLIKIDIEGDEYRLLNDILKFSNQIVGVIIEFHNIDLHINKVKKFIDEFNLKLVHTHVNNSGVIIDKTPSIIECTFAKSPIMLSELNSTYHKLDQPNLKNKVEYKIKYI